MKIQDGIFFILLIVIALFKKPALLSIFGVIFLILATPLFAGWIFFTAQRLVIYAAVCFFFSIFLAPRRHS